MQNGGWEAPSQFPSEAGGRVGQGTEEAQAASLQQLGWFPCSGFLDMSDITLLDSSDAGVWSSPAPSTVPASGPEDVGSSSSSHERGGEWSTLWGLPVEWPAR